MDLTYEEALAVVQIIKPKARARWSRRTWLLLTCLLGCSLVVAWWANRAPEPTLEFSAPVRIAEETREIQIEAFLPQSVGPEQTRFPAIVLLHGIEGPHRFRDSRNLTADQLRDAGFAVFIVHYFGAVDYPDLYHFRADGTLDHELIEAKRIADSNKWIAATTAAIEQIARRDDVDPQRIAINGFSLGGFIAISAAEASLSDPHVPDVKCLVVNWGAMFRDAQPCCGFPPTLFVHGELDPIVPLKYAQQTMAALNTIGTPNELVVVPGAGHIARSKESDRATLAILSQHLQP